MLYAYTKSGRKQCFRIIKSHLNRKIIIMILALARLAADSLLFQAAAICCCCSIVAIVSAVEQPDLVRLDGSFETSVQTLMAANKGMAKDVAEMLVASNDLAESEGDTIKAEKLNMALCSVDDLQRSVAELYDATYDCYLDLYPAWRMYLLCEIPEDRQLLLSNYMTILKQYRLSKKEFINYFNLLMDLQETLLPSNAFVDRYNLNQPSPDLALLLN